MDRLILNSFSVEISSREVSLPFKEFSSWEESTVAKEGELRDFVTWRFQTDEKRIRAVLIAGPPPPELPTDSFDLGRFWRVGTILIEHAMRQHLSKAGMTVKPGHFETIALRQATGSPHSMIQLYTGVSFSARRPFRDEPYRFTLSFQWEASAQFKESLENASLFAICKGMPVLYQPVTEPPKELLLYRNRYLGKVEDTGDGMLVLVRCKDDISRHVPRGDLWLEPSPATLRKYEKQIGTSFRSTSVWRKIQENSLVLTKENRRNTAVLRDRLEAIRGILGGGVGSTKAELTLPLASIQEGFITISLLPVQVGVLSAW